MVANPSNRSLAEPYVAITRMADGTIKEEHRRRPDGIWYGPPDGQPQNTRLSAVLAIFRSLEFCDQDRSACSQSLGCNAYPSTESSDGRVVPLKRGLSALRGAARRCASPYARAMAGSVNPFCCRAHQDCV